jgi:hypothetical protein
MMRSTRLGLALLLMVNVASAQEIVAVQEVSSLAGKWKGPGGPCALARQLSWNRQTIPMELMRLW